METQFLDDSTILDQVLTALNQVISKKTKLIIEPPRQPSVAEEAAKALGLTPSTLEELISGSAIENRSRRDRSRKQ